jgi:hypothetical protein
MEKVCHICEKTFNVLPQILENKILFMKKALQYYEYLDDKQSIDRYTKSLKK